MSVKVAFIGLGVMGFPMAGHLAAAGHQVTVYNRTRQKALQWCQQYDGAMAATPAQAADGAELVFACVGNDDDVRAIALGEKGVFAGMQAGSLFVDHTTASANVALELAAVAATRDLAFMDAPVSGGEAGAKNGQLAIMFGGTEQHYSRVTPVVRCYARAVQLIGPVGDGQKCKMVNQICIAGLVQALAEALNFARAAELDIDKVIAAISKGAAQSWQMENRYATMVRNEFDFGFATDWMRKDLKIALDEAARLRVSVPVTTLVDQFYAEIQNLGGGRWDTSSLIARL